ENYAGSSYVVFGSNSGFDAQLNLSSLNGSNGFVINGIDARDFSGGSVSSAGDINGDGFDDLIIGANLADPNGQDRAGSSYVVFGSNSGFDAQLNFSSLNGSNGFVINGIDAGDFSGFPVSSAGDINGDGFDDLIIGANLADPNGQNYAGESYVVFGFASSTPTNKPPVAVNDSATTDEDTAVNIEVLANDRNSLTVSAVDGNTIAVGTAITLSSGALVTLNVDGSLTYDPNASFESLAVDERATDSFTYTISNGSLTNTASVNLTINGVNDAPVAVNDSLTNGFNTPVTILASTLLANDTDIDINNLSITAVTGATNGTAVLNNNGTVGNLADDFIVFTPFNGLSGNANFNYTISDGSLTSTARVAIAVGANITGTNENDTISGTPGNDAIAGGNGNDNISGGAGNDTFVLGLGDGNDTITDFAGIGIGSNPSTTMISQLDTLQFIGSGLTAQNLQLTQNGNNLELTFLDVDSPKVTLQNFQLENLDNVPAKGSRPAIGNILFDGQTNVTDSFDVFNANSTQTNLFNKNTVTFLNDLNNNVAGFDNSNDVINGQGGNDIINGNSGNDLLRGGLGDDVLIGSEGNDTLVGGNGNDVLIGGVGADKFLYNTNAEFSSAAVGIYAITDFKSSEGDKIVLDKTTFGAITSAAGTGFSNANDFQITSNAGTSTATIVYDSVSGQLFYNQNGSAGLFATLTGAPTLTASDFLLQA
ncbi:beta strand repeat-containing protein, partial [Nostoc sp.]|uniref:beta strand repeat-containing protein n=1 Tax=Nostoc sp. TaxID=1180 RepID=UPI002FF6D3CA